MKTDKWLVTAIGVIGLVAGIIEPRLPHSGKASNAVGLVQSFVLAILLFSWCKAHAKANGMTPHTASPILSALLPPVGLPYYFFRGFGWPKGGYLLLMAIGIAVVFSALYVVCFVLSMRFGA